MTANRSIGLFLLCLFASGCAAARIGFILPKCNGQVLRVKEDGPGADLLAAETDYDTAIRNFVRQNGEPDYLYVTGYYSVQFIYLDDERLVLFERGKLTTTSRATVSEGIPDATVALFAAADRERLSRLRWIRRGMGIR